MSGPAPQQGPGPAPGSAPEPGPGSASGPGPAPGPGSERGPGSASGPTEFRRPGTQTGDAWADYLAAAQRLDAVRRQQTSTATERERTTQAARDELAGVRARLAPQRARLRELGAPDEELTPGPQETAAAAQAIGPDPASALGALRQARATADAADATVVGTGGVGPPRGSAWWRNLLVYGPFAAVALAVQLALYVAADGSSLPLYAALCGLTMPGAAFGLGWLVIGLVFPPGPHGRVERTPLLGAVVCFAPVLMTCVGVGALAVMR